MAKFVEGCIRHGEEILRHEDAVNGITYSLRENISNGEIGLYQKMIQGNGVVYDLIAEFENLDVADCFLDCILTGEVPVDCGLIKCELCGILLRNL